MKIVFLTNSFTCTAVAYIKSLLEANIEITGIVLLEQLNVGRIFGKARKYGLGHILKRVIEAINMRILSLPALVGGKQKGNVQKSIEVLIRENRLNVYKVKDVNSNKTKDIIRSLNPDLIFVCTLSQILKAQIIEIPKLGCINIHTGLLPKYRGPASNFWVLYNNEQKTGVSFHYLTTGIDSGDILLQKELSIINSDTEETLDIRLSELGAEYIPGLIRDIEKKRVHRIPQNEKDATYFSQPSIKQRKELKSKRKR